jgi:hypothetical protein
VLALQVCTTTLGATLALQVCTTTLGATLVFISVLKNDCPFFGFVLGNPTFPRTKRAEGTYKF